MEGRWPNGLTMVFANADDPANEAALDKWYVEMHVPDVTNPGIFPICTRYENPAAKGGAEQPKFMASYETERDDPAAAWKENRTHTAPLREQGRISPHIKSTMVGVYKKVGASPSAAGKSTTGILLVLSDLTDPAREAELKKWYLEVHIPDILSTGLYHGAGFYENVGDAPDQPRFLAVYETDQADPMAAVGPTLKQAAEMGKQPGHGIDCLAPKLITGYNLTYSNAAARAASS
ncbi:MAG: hypothetical protein IIC82_03665 [Chloroflexi bacterium]|nr:hypothetical protein [Chloroflexota bacterium]